MRRHRSDSRNMWWFFALLMLFLYLQNTCHAAQKCIAACEKIDLYGKPVTQCVYDELPRCDFRQPKCIDSESVVCKNRVTKLGEWRNVVLNEPVSSWSWSRH